MAANIDGDKIEVMGAEILPTLKCIFDHQLIPKCHAIDNWHLVPAFCPCGPDGETNNQFKGIPRLVFILCGTIYCKNSLSGITPTGL